MAGIGALAPRRLWRPVQQDRDQRGLQLLVQGPDRMAPEQGGGLLDRAPAPLAPPHLTPRRPFLEDFHHPNDDGEAQWALLVVVGADRLPRMRPRTPASSSASPSAARSQSSPGSIYPFGTLQLDLSFLRIRQICSPSSARRIGITAACPGVAVQSCIPVFLKGGRRNRFRRSTASSTPAAAERPDCATGQEPLAASAKVGLRVPPPVTPRVREADRVGGGATGLLQPACGEVLRCEVASRG